MKTFLERAKEKIIEDFTFILVVSLLSGAAVLFSLILAVVCLAKIYHK